MCLLFSLLLFFFFHLLPFRVQWQSDILQHLSRARTSNVLYIFEYIHTHLQPSVIGGGASVVAATAIVERCSDCSKGKAISRSGEERASNRSLHKSNVFPFLRLVSTRMMFIGHCRILSDMRIGKGAVSVALGLLGRYLCTPDANNFPSTRVTFFSRFALVVASTFHSHSNDNNYTHTHTRARERDKNQTKLIRHVLLCV